MPTRIITQRRSKAADTFEGFHDYPSKHFGEFHRSLTIPDTVLVAGPCAWVTYRSDKWNDGSFDYIHEIDSFPRVYTGYVGGMDAPSRRLPKKVCADNQVLNRIGKALGWAFDDHGQEIEAKAPARCEWWWSPSAKALFAIESMRKLHLVVWGGRLDVEDRGIVG